MIISFVIKISQNMLVLKILNEGLMVNQHFKSITKSKFFLHLLPQPRHFIIKWILYKKYSYAYLSHGAL